jgi:hyperosmotically inducible protein
MTCMYGFGASFFLEGVTMIFRSRSGRTLLVAAIISAALAGCGKHANDDTGGGTEPSGAGGSAESPATGASGTAASAGRAIDDSVITTKLKTALLTDSTLKGADISVETRNGEVVLTGSILNPAQKDHAAKVAQAMNGVKGVNNKLVMKK